MKRAARTARARTPRPYVPRKTVYELPPLELECMKVLWLRGEASVRQIREQLAADARPLAYTTVETIMDRLTRKGVVERRKVGKAHRYTPVYQLSDARAQAVAALVQHFFDGSRQALLAHLQSPPASTARRSLRSLAAARPRVAPPSRRDVAASRSRRPTPAPTAKPERPLDTTLL